MSSEEKISFKKVRSKAIRRRRSSSDENDSDSEIKTLSSTLEESKELRKLKRKVGGVTAEGLLVGAKNKEEKKDDDPYKSKRGGMVDINELKKAPKMDDAYDTGIGTSFSAETNRRDEDAEMQKFIEENLAKRKGTEDKDDANKPEEIKYQTPEQAALNSVPEFLRKSSSKTNEEMLSNQMLSGIPEIDLGLEAKIKNIESTEEAKQKIYRDSLRKKDKPSEFVPKNMAVNFVQHNRFNIEDSQAKKKAKPEQKVEEFIVPVVGGGVKVSTVAPKKSTTQKATDDFHYEKFRKQFKRH